MKDLSHLAADAMWVTSQAGGNMQSSNRLAMAAPGSQPVDPVPDRTQQGDPHIELGPARPPGRDGKPQPARSYTPNPARWGPVTSPDVVRGSQTGGS